MSENSKIEVWSDPNKNVIRHSQVRSHYQLPLCSWKIIRKEQYCEDLHNIKQKKALKDPSLSFTICIQFYSSVHSTIQG